MAASEASTGAVVQPPASGADGCDGGLPRAGDPIRSGAAVIAVSCPRCCGIYRRRPPWCRCGCFAVENSGRDVRTFQAWAGPVVALTTLQICSLQSHTPGYSRRRTDVPGKTPVPGHAADSACLANRMEIHLRLAGHQRRSSRRHCIGPSRHSAAVSAPALHRPPLPRRPGHLERRPACRSRPARWTARQPQPLPPYLPVNKVLSSSPTSGKPRRVAFRRL